MSASLLFEKFIQQVLLEKKSDDLKKQYPDLSSEIDQLESGIPVNYLTWATKQVKTGSKTADLIPTINYFDKHKQRFQERDINKYNGSSLEAAVKSISSAKSKKQARADVKAEGAEKIYEDDSRVILFIKNKEASVCYGAGTKWCITMKDADYFETYSEQNVIFYFDIDKKLPPSDPLSKYAYAVIRDVNNDVKDIEIYDAEDDLKSEEHLSYKTRQIITQDAVNRPINPRYALKNGLLSREQLITVSEDEKADEKDKLIAVKSLLGRRFELYWEDHPDEYFDLLRRLSKSKNDHIVKEAIEFIPERMFRLFLTHPSAEIRRQVAAYSTNTDTLLALRNDENEDVRVTVIESLPAYYLKEMIDDPNPRIRKFIAMRIRDVPNPEFFKKYLHDEDPKVRKQAALSYEKIAKEEQIFDEEV